MFKVSGKLKKERFYVKRKKEISNKTTRILTDKKVITKSRWKKNCN